MESFSSNCTPNNSEKVDSLKDRFSASYKEFKEKHASSCNCKAIYITLYDVIDAVNSMKGGKSSDGDDISAEHLQNAPLNFLVRLLLAAQSNVEARLCSESISARFHDSYP